ncbi:MAG: hypothetical protein D6768_05640 [Chloroflexi bacterium]|nr:MAG: hypothetical protein D6768_05640 [Chloroflexota bacterium]
MRNFSFGNVASNKSGRRIRIQRPLLFDLRFKMQALRFKMQALHFRAVAVQVIPAAADKMYLFRCAPKFWGGGWGEG